MVSPIPAGYHSVTPYLICRNAVKAIEFYQKAFGAHELFRIAGPDGQIGHAEVRIGDSVVMLADEHPEMGAKSPKSFGGSPVSLLIYVPNVDDVFQRALAAGATQERPIEDKFYGDRSGQLADPFGHTWTIATHIEDVTVDEVRRRAAAMFG